VGRGRFRVVQVLTKSGAVSGSSNLDASIITAAKTTEGVRTMTMCPWLFAELLEWRAQLEAGVCPSAMTTSSCRGLRDGHYTIDQQRNFIRDIKACGRVAAERDSDVAFLKTVTPYSLRRGHISPRVLTGEDIKRITDECGTSTAMAHRHYLHDLDMRHELPDDFSFDHAVRAARRELRHRRAG
jgi:hypothetical protein